MVVRKAQLMAPCYEKSPAVAAFDAGHDAIVAGADRDAIAEVQYSGGHRNTEYGLAKPPLNSCASTRGA